jgi:hypothetical protein
MPFRFDIFEDADDLRGGDRRDWPFTQISGQFLQKPTPL